MTVQMRAGLGLDDMGVDMESRSDQELLEVARAGNQAALQQLMARCGAALRPALDINPKWRAALDLDDVLQVTYIEAYLGLREFSGDAVGFRRWFERIAKNNLRDAIKGLNRDKRLPPDRKLDAPPGQDPILWLYMIATGGGTTPSRKFARKEILAILESEISRLPADYAEILRLRYFSRLELSDAATEMNRTYGAVYLLHERALERLRAQLGSTSRIYDISS